MPRLTRAEVYTQRMARLFFQMGAPAPDVPVTFYGVNNQYAELKGVKESFGSVDPIYMRSPSITDGYTIVGRKRDVPDLTEASLVMYQKIGYVPKNLGVGGCEFNVYLPVGNCKALDDPTNGWEYMEVFGGCVAEDRDGDDVFVQDSDEARMDTYSLKIAETYRIGQLGFGEFAAPYIDREVVDVVFGGGLSCGNCGPADDGTSRIYAVTQGSGSGSPGLPAQVIYVSRNTNTGATTVYEYDLTYLASTENPSAIAIMGNYLIVVSNDAGSIAYATIDSNTGTLGSFTEITSGVVAGKEPNDIYVASNFQAWVCGDGGYIYSLTDVTAGLVVADAGNATTSNLNRIHGEGRTIVSVGASGAVVFSTNGGDSWGIPSGSLGSGALTAVSVLSDTFWYVGGTNRYYTRNGGVSWTTQPIAGAVGISDIVFVTPEVGYTLYVTSSVCKIQVTTFGGAIWSDVGAGTVVSRVRGWPTFASGNRLAVPNSATNIAVSALAVAGRYQGSGTDGRLLLGLQAEL